MKRIVVILVVAAILLVAGYLTYPMVFEGRAPTPETVTYAVPSVPQALVREAPAKELSQQAQPLAQYSSLRNVTISVYMKLQVGDINSAQQRLSEVASRYGGYVQSSSVYEGGGYFTLRIPAGKVESALNDVRTLGKVEREEKSVEDVTEQIIDVETRLKSLKATESRLLALLDKAEKVSDIIEIEDKLSQVRQQIEWLEASRKNLQLMVSYATISVELRKVGYVAPEEDPLNRIWEDARKAFLGSLYLIVVGIAFLTLPLGLLAIAYLTYRNLRSREKRRSELATQ
ncbi:MAG: DUF4349 domain-containing protein [Candidatus Korarchaeum sp.]|nr:DUF4349 domain-containing protein [Candidatus Korarchaeum sp.]MDW8035096.1 DUF4349 domain-containing protein [Candidatus Korarchaeum sp.]